MKAEAQRVDYYLCVCPYGHHQSAATFLQEVVSVVL